jgi:hypothetical protein
MNTLRAKQRGISLTQLMLWGTVLGLVAVIAMKAVPSFIAYQSVLKAVKRLASEAGAQGSIPKIKDAFAKQMEVDNIKTITADDLEIYKENGQIIISFAFTDKIKLVGPTSLLIEYKGTSKGVE